MSKFQGGPADGKQLELGRAPHFIRVVVSDGGKIDALDQLDDTPTEFEKPFLYSKVSDDGSCHISGRDQKTGKRFGRWLQMATYRFVEFQPPDATMRSTKLWQDWCLSQPEAKAESVS